MSLLGEVDDTEIEVLLGEVIGKPSSARTAHRMHGHSDRVIKLRKADTYTSNRIEWDVWQEIAGSKVARLFGECFAISKSGRYLAMEYLGDLEDADIPRIPRLPIWFRDRKVVNLGKAADGSIKVRDYGVVDPSTDRPNAMLQTWPTRTDVEGMLDIVARLNAIESSDGGEAQAGSENP